MRIERVDDNKDSRSLKMLRSKVFDALILLAVLCNRMNVINAKHVDLTKPFDGLIRGKLIKFLLIYASNIKLSQLHCVQIYDSH